MQNVTATMNGTQPQNCESSSYHTAAVKIGQAFGYCLFLVISLVGNALIAIIIHKIKSMRTTTNYFILNTAMSDLLLPILVLPSFLTEIYGGFWFFRGEEGLVVCKVVFFLQYVSCLVSIESLVLIAVDRFGAVVYPLRPPLFSSKLCLFSILATWVAAVSLCSPNFFGYKAVQYAGEFQSCQLVWKQSFLADNYLHGLPFVLVAISFSIIAILYCIVLFKLKSQKTPGEQSVNVVKQREKRQKSVLRMTVAIVTGFVLCWGPATIFVLLNVFVWHKTPGLSCVVTTYWYILLAKFMASANCAINPCICFAFSEKYRQGLKRLLRRQ